jgi:hypothetical protein
MPDNYLSLVKSQGVSRPKGFSKDSIKVSVGKGHTVDVAKDIGILF